MCGSIGAWFDLKESALARFSNLRSAVGISQREPSNEPLQPTSGAGVSN